MPTYVAVAPVVPIVIIAGTANGGQKIETAPRAVAVANVVIIFPTEDIFFLVHNVK